MRSLVKGPSRCMAVACCTVYAAFAQVPAASPAFDVTSVKLNTLPPRERTGEFGCSHGTFVARVQTVSRSIRWAYHTDWIPLLRAPTWANVDPYDIEAKASGSVSEDQCRVMVRTLLADRFKLRAHLELVETPVYALVVAKGGPKIQKVTESDPPNGVRFVMDGSVMPMFDPSLKGWSMEQLALALSVAGLERPIVDRTGLEGVYKFSLEFYERESDAGGVDVTTAVQGQLGLKLEPRKEQIPTVVVDHVERPTAN